MTLQEIFSKILYSEGQDMLDQLKKLTPVEKEYINARIIINSLEENILNIQMFDLPWQTEEKYKKDLNDWKQKVSIMESKQHLAES